MKINKKKLVFYIVGIVAGIALVLTGVLLRDRAAKEVVGICAGLGTGVFGMFVSNLITMLIETKNPEAVRIKKIAVNDERNAAIRDKAGARANRALSVVLPVVTMIFALMNVELAVTLIMCGVILLQAFVSIYYNDYYSKRM